MSLPTPLFGDDSARMWVTALPLSEPAEPNIVLAVDTRGGVDERLACDLFNYGHEGEEGVFYLLPMDLWARVEVTGDRLVVRLVTSRQRIVDSGAHRDEEFGRLVAELPLEEIPDGRVTVLRREIRIDPAALADQAGLLPGPGHRAALSPEGEPCGDDLRPVLILDHEGPATLEQLVAALGDEEASVMVVGAD
ncbi:hypothetical protein GA0074692_3305 [Micromonospora pallida]|uniref:Uncharacterized protein n=1 Tax=Micromonospora pallida TaxID=145854 RepID=A0A1C6SSD7_9ACTN|nr:hypothetical protein [Micromonospora pallida]SCL32400.1 hypothetical protein GA0074692_3305 [Micromonospora pallida]